MNRRRLLQEERERLSRVMLQTVRSPVLALWALQLLSVPFYLRESGLPQPGNLLIFALAPLTFRGWNGTLEAAHMRVVRWLLLFTLWVCLVDIGWTIALGGGLDTKSAAIYPFYYIYNLVLLLSALILNRRFGNDFIRLTFYAVGITVLVQVVVSVVRSDASRIREELFFNNPNQLGFFALTAACLVAVCERYLRVGIVKTSAILLGCAYLAFISASRAAVGAIGILFFMLVFTNPRVVVIASLCAGAALSLGPVSHAIDMTEERIEYRRDENVVAGRAYDRIWNYPEYLVLGAGEGNTQRFVEEGRRASEIHSSFGTVAFSYGVIGFALFMAFVWSLLQGSSLRLTVMILPAFAYSVTHQGLRSAMLWILFALFLAVKRRRTPAAATT